MVDVSRATSGIDLPRDLSGEIWGNTIDSSVVMSSARRINLPGRGLTINSITADPTAAWVGETESKPVSRPTFANKAMTPYKLAVIVPFSDEFRRDLPGLYAECARRLPGALAKQFDQTVFGYTAAPGANFDQLDDSATISTVDDTGTTADLVDAYQAVVAAGGDLSHWLASPALVGLLISARSEEDSFSLSNGLQVGSVFGAPVLRTKASMPAGVLGYAGDFASDAVYGTVEGVQVSVSDQATLSDGQSTINLWQQNMFALRAEVEIGFRVRDVDAFGVLTDGTFSGS